jgi:hypothetical protein
VPIPVGLVETAVAAVEGHGFPADEDVLDPGLGLEDVARGEERTAAGTARERTATGMAAASRRDTFVRRGFLAT